MSEKTNKVDRLYSHLAFMAMSDMLNLPKKIDELKKLPAYVKDGEVFDFNDRSFGETSKPDGEIFSVEKVMKTQAVTQALKTAYTKALGAWVNGEAEGETEKPKKVKKSKTDEAESNDDTLDLVADVKELLEAGKLKKANKMIKDNPDHPKAKKAKKLYKKAVKATESE